MTRRRHSIRQKPTMSTQPDVQAQHVAAALDDRVPTAVVIVHGMGE